MNSIDQLLASVDNTILNYVQGAFGNLSPVVSALWASMFVIFIAVYGYKVIISGRFTMSDLWVHCFKIIAVLVLATQWAAFSVFILDMVTNLPSDIAGQLINTASGGSDNITSANTALGDFYGRGMEASANITEGAGWGMGGLILFGYSIIVWLATLALTGYAIMLIVLSKVAVAVLLAVGPVFILMLIFMQTKSLFEGWLRTLLNYALIPIFVYGLLSLLLTLIDLPLTNMATNVEAGANIMESIAPFILVSFVSILLLAQVMNLSSGISGGISLSTMGIVRHSAARPLGRGTKTIGGYARGRADNAVDKTFRTGAHSSENKLRNALPRTRGSN